MIPVSVIMLTKNEAANIPRTLPPLIRHFDQVFVVDSHSTDQTQAIAATLGATVIPFRWNGQYPKKKQWSIDHLPLRHDWIFLCDADEEITDDFIAELRACDWRKDGYFVPARMIWNGRPLNFGIRNNKLCLFRYDRFHHPVIDDLDIAGGWEVEGHYQPIPATPNTAIGQITSPLYHRDETADWIRRHERYIAWESGMIRRNAFPPDPVRYRQFIKTILRASRFAGIITLLWGYIVKGGFMDGRSGLDYALRRAWYRRRIARAVQDSNLSR